jgi:twitching motility protein PilT
VADPLERRLPDEGVGVLQRQIPEDVPNAGRAVGDALRLEARLVLVDIPRPEAVAVDLLALAGQGRLVIATWTASSSVAAVEALMDALPPSLAHTERARRTRNLRSVVGVRLMPARAGGVLPIFETLQLNQVVLSAVTEARLGQSAGTDARELCSLSFEASMAALKSRGLI